MKRFAIPALLLVFLLGGAAPAILADALQDVRIDTEEDEKRNTIFKLVNSGERMVLVTIEYEKVCSGVANTQKPKTRQLGVRPKSSVQLAKAWSQTTCRREYRIVKADYQ